MSSGSYYEEEMSSGGHRRLTAFILWPFPLSKKSPLDPPSPWSWLGAYIETHLATQGHDPFYCHCIRTQFLNSGVNLETLPAAYVTLWLWEALPPPEQSLPLSRQKAAVMPEAV